MKILDGKKLADSKSLKLKDLVSKLPSKPILAVLQVGSKEESNVFIRNKKERAEQIGIGFELYNFPEDVQEAEIIDRIKKLNESVLIHGIMIQFPLPKTLNQATIVNSIAWFKDVDGLGAFNKGLLEMDQAWLISPTALAVWQILINNSVVIQSKRVVVVGDGEVAGKPIARLLLNKNATVTTCNEFTEDLPSFTRGAKILISAVGKKHFIKRNMISENQIIIDVGTTSVSGEIYGDVDFFAVEPVVLKITPTPGGIGPLTVYHLLENVVKCYKYVNKEILNE